MTVKMCITPQWYSVKGMHRSNIYCYLVCSRIKSTQKVHHRQGSISAKEVNLNLDEFKKKKDANLECESEIQKKSEDELCLEVVGGWNEKGRIFGLGAVAHSYNDRPTYEERNGKKSWRDYIRSLETRVIELAAKNDDQKKELDQTKQELGETKQRLVETQTTLVRIQTFKQQVEKFMQANQTRS
ncbi:NADPH-dependent 7-cyano-7-deazaguanine reductase [Bienertia sinuspersici]